MFTRRAIDVFNPVTSGGAARGADMGETLVWGSEIELVVGSSAASGGAIIFASKAAMDGDLAHAAGKAAWVVGDATVANNAIYRKTGTSGSGSWVYAGPLPYQVISLAVSGTANALVAVSNVPVPTADRAALLLLPTPLANTGAVTLVVNGAAALPVLDRNGAPLTEGFFLSGGSAMLVRSDSAYRAFLDNDYAGAMATIVEALAELNTLYLGEKTTFPALDNAGNALISGALVSITDQPDADDDGMYVWRDGAWRAIGVLPSAFQRRGSYRVEAAGETNILVEGGYAPGQISVFFNGAHVQLGADPEIGAAAPGATAADGALIVFPASFLVEGDLVEWIITRPFAVADITAADVSLGPVGGLAATNLQAAIEEIMDDPDFVAPKKGGADLATESYVDLAVAGVGAAVEGFEIDVADSAGALTVSLLNSAGAAPSLGTPVAISFPTASGGAVRRTITSSLSLAIPSGATLGVAAVNTAFAVWFLLFDDAGTQRVAAVQCRINSGADNAIRRLRVWDFESATAIDTASDTAGVLYCGASVSAKPFVVLGKAEWDSGLATLGTWTAPSRFLVFAPGMPLPGDVVQTLNKNGAGSANSTTTMTAGTGASQAITIKPCNAVKLRGCCNGLIAAAASGNPQFQASLFRDSTDLTTTQTVGATSGGGGINQNFSGGVAMQALDFPNTGSAVTYSLRHRTTVSGTNATASAICLDLEEICA